MKTYFLLILFCATLFGCRKEVSALNQEEPPVETGPTLISPRLNEMKTAMNGSVGGFVQTLPGDYLTSKKTYPLILAIHGINECGNGTTDLYKIEKKGIPGLIANNTFPTSFTCGKKSFEFIVIAPQFKTFPGTATLNYTLDYIINHYRVDTTRIYITGYSMGGGTVWEYAATYAKRVAAVVPVCGASSPTITKATAIAKSGVAVWAFHNDGDPKIACGNTINYIKYINAAKPIIEAKKTIFHASKHNAWNSAYNINYKENNMNVFEWMLQYQRNTTSK